MTRRSGMSLAEVLVALFLVALGTISILTLFPIGTLQMGQALKDDRTAQAAVQADAFMRTYWKVMVTEASPATSDPFVTAFTDPTNANNPTSPIPNPKQPNLLPVTAGPGYPVVVDPMGFVARGVPDQFWIADQSSNTNLARRTLQTIGNSFQATRTCCLQDGLGYSPNGAANVTASGTIDREARYNWLWVIQPMNLADPNTANMTIVVFDKRAPLFAPASAETVFVPVACAPGTTTVSFTLGAAPPVQKGSWLLDATVTHIDFKGVTYVPPSPPPNPPSAPTQMPTAAVRNANFYRVVSVTDNTLGGTTDIELQTPLLSSDVKTPGTPDALANQRRFVVLAGVSEVFQRPPLAATP